MYSPTFANRCWFAYKIAINMIAKSALKISRWILLDFLSAKPTTSKNAWSVNNQTVCVSSSSNHPSPQLPKNPVMNFGKVMMLLTSRLFAVVVIPSLTATRGSLKMLTWL